MLLKKIYLVFWVKYKVLGKMMKLYQV